MPNASRPDATRSEVAWGAIYAWAGFAIMWPVWLCFIVLLANPKWALRHWPLPTVDGPARGLGMWTSVLVDLGLVAIFGLQHSLMARPWFKSRVLGNLPPAFVRCTYVHAANLALFALVALWQPIPIEVWSIPSPGRELMHVAFVSGWLLLLVSALSFGILELLGIEQMRAWARGVPPTQRLRTGRVYRWMSHPMYVGVLLAVWATPLMTLGHLLLSAGMTVYVLVALRYEERDLSERFGKAYARWRMRKPGAGSPSAVR